jgi:DNA-binding MarR family transcriptional regulator
MANITPDLSRRIAGVSQTTLTQTLRQLERNGLLNRTLTPAATVRVDYQLTALGETMLPIVAAIDQRSELISTKFMPLETPTTTRTAGNRIAVAGTVTHSRQPCQIQVGTRPLAGQPRRESPALPERAATVAVPHLIAALDDLQQRGREAVGAAWPSQHCEGALPEVLAGRILLG